MPKFLEYERWSKAKAVAVKCHALAVLLKQAGETEVATAIFKEALQLAGSATSKTEVDGGARPPIQLNLMLTHSRRLQSDLLIATELGLLKQVEIAPIIEEIDELPSNYGLPARKPLALTKRK